MSSQLRFEGNDLEILLERVRVEVGHDARIVAANKLRKGGVGGFFSKEMFEVIVEQIASEHAETLRPAARFGRARKHSKYQEPAVAALIVDLVDDELDELHSATSTSMIDLTEPPAISTQTERFAEILERLAQRQDDDDDGISISHTAMEQSRADAITIDKETVPEPTIYRRSNAAVRTTPAPYGTQALTLAPTLAPTMAPTMAPILAGPQEIEVIRKPTLEVQIDLDEDLIERPEQVLLKMGVPAKFIPRGQTGGSLRASLVEALTNLPKVSPLPHSRGTTIAIIGVGARPVALARMLAVEAGIDPDTVVIATANELNNAIPSWLQITNGDEAHERRLSWRRRSHASFVAISVPSVAAETAWTNEMLDALEPSQIWAVANAGWKHDDVQAWSKRIGGFDVLALERLEETVSPATLMAVGIPIARVDGEPIDAEQWAELLLDRVVIA